MQISMRIQIWMLIWLWIFMRMQMWIQTRGLDMDPSGWLCYCAHICTIVLLKRAKCAMCDCVTFAHFEMCDCSFKERKKCTLKTLTLFSHIFAQSDCANVRMFALIKKAKKERPHNHSSGKSNCENVKIFALFKWAKKEQSHNFSFWKSKNVQCAIVGICKCVNAQPWI